MGAAMAFKLMLWAAFGGYALLLARWSAKNPASLLFPLALLLGAAVWPGLYTAFFFLLMGVLGWLRSGICFSSHPARAIIAETIIGAGGAGLLAWLNPGSALAWTISIWLFFLLQALYFFIVPVPGLKTAPRSSLDTFERAYRGALRVLDESG
jgi:hypothetical protein